MKTARQVVQVVGCVSFLLMGVGTLSHALGQSSAPKVDNPCKDTTKYPDNFSKLACVITHKFPSISKITSPTTSVTLTNLQAYPSRNWCVEVESDPTENWWGFKFNGYYYPHSIEYGKRIRLIYKATDPNNNQYVNFASLFLGMDFLETGDYGVRTPFVEDTSDNNPIIFPAATDAGCVNLSDFLKVAFAGNARFWSPLGNVLCDNSDDNVNNHCQQRSGSDGKLYWERQNSQSSETDPLYWRFNYRTHAIPGAMSFWVQFCKTDTCPDDSRTVIYGYLIIGYGGNGGAG